MKLRTALTDLLAIDLPLVQAPIATLPDGRAMPRYGFAFPRRGMQGDLAGMAPYAGQSVGLVRDIRPAAEIVRRHGSEVETVLARLGALAHPAQA
jgi:NAD(P)H-dependent flavin oxidoreductase YrpB (nitropropane dioxygenase family)